MLARREEGNPRGTLTPASAPHAPSPRPHPNPSEHGAATEAHVEEGGGIHIAHAAADGTASAAVSATVSAATSATSGAEGTLDGALSIEMGAGDVMYVPPFWTHAVLTTGDAGEADDAGGDNQRASPSLSLSLIAPSWIETRWGALKGVRLPFGGPYAPGPTHAPADERSPRGVLLARAAAVGCYLRVLLEGRAESFAAALYLQRYAPITAADETEATRARDAASRLGDDDQSGERQGGWVDSCPREWRLPEVVAGQEAEAAEAAAAALWRILAVAGEAPQQRLEPALREHLLRDYVDELVGWAVGSGPIGGELIHCWGGRGDGVGLTKRIGKGKGM